jgi:hypothetical protein
MIARLIVAHLPSPIPRSATAFELKHDGYRLI